MKKKTLRERPFEYLRSLDSNQPFPEETVRNWYMARAYVLDALKEVAFIPGAGEHLHAVVDGDSPLMLSVLRQLALSAHYVNYGEYDLLGRYCGKNRTVLTIVSNKDKDVLLNELGKEEYLNQLVHHCRLTVYGEADNEDSFIDLELNIVHDRPDAFTICISEGDVKAFAASRDPEELFSVDTRKAVLTDKVYELGKVIDNIPNEDIHSARRYLHALDTFQYNLLDGKPKPLVNDARWSVSQTAVRNGLSSLFCSDCFESRALSIRRYGKAAGVKEQDAWEKNNEALSVSEHNRWVVDKLIMGFRPVTAEERLRYETLFGRRRYEYWRHLKNDASSPSHIDMCSYRDLRRIDPENLKYDSFLMLAIPIILRKLKIR